MPSQQSSSDKHKRAGTLQIGTVSKNIKIKQFPDSWRAGFYAGEIHRERGELNLTAGLWLSSCPYRHHSSLWTVTAFSTLPRHLCVGSTLVLQDCRSHCLQLRALLRELCLQRAVGSGPVFMHGAGQRCEFLLGEQLSWLQKKPERGCANRDTQLVLYSLS